MNRMKSAFKAVRDYLGRDTKGIELLQKAELVANELRTENASLRQRIEDATNRSIENHASRLESDRKLAHEVLLRHATEAKLVQSQRTIEKLQNQIKPPPPKDKKESLADENALVRQLSTLHSENFKWPMSEKTRIAERTYGKTEEESYDVADIVKNWSGSEIMKLGRFVAYHAVRGQHVAYYSSETCPMNDKLLEELAILALRMMPVTTVIEDMSDAMLVSSKSAPPRLRRGELEILTGGSAS
jgi:hypothetical protein